MRIAVFTIRQQKGIPLDKDDYITEISVSLAKQQPYHQFIFLFNTADISTINFPHNVEPVRIRNSFFWWFDVKLSRILKQHKVDVFVTLDCCLSRGMKVTQVLVLQDLEFSKSNWLQKFFVSKSIRNANVVCTTSDFLRQEVAARYKKEPDKILSIGRFVKPVYEPAEWPEKEGIKKAYSDECEYFLFVIINSSQESLMTLLKAFAIFKRWQKTNMKLLLIRKSTIPVTSTEEKLKTFKYRGDIKFLIQLPEDELAKVFASAYALIHLGSKQEGFALPVLQAMQCEVPVITSHVGSMAEIGGDSVLYADPSNPREIAEQMKKIFKDEQLRSNLIASAKSRAGTFSLQKTTELLWQAIQQAVSK